MEHWDELWPGGFRFRFDDNVFKPSTDTFLLGDFAEVRRGERVCDLGAGIGLLGLLLLARQQELHITNIDIDSAACALAEENAAVNGLEERVAVLRADLRDRTALPKAGSFDLCVANPPYFPPHTGRVAEGSRGTARSETACAFDQLCAAAAYLLRSGGRFCLVHRAERTAELMDVLRRHRLEPKVLRFVQKDPQVCCRCAQGGGRHSGRGHPAGTAVGFAERSRVCIAGAPGHPARRRAGCHQRFYRLAAHRRSHSAAAHGQTVCFPAGKAGRWLVR